MTRQVLITGALGTLGLAQAARFSAAGENVIMLDHPRLADRQAVLMSDPLLSRVRFVFQDLSDLAGSERVVRDLAEERGGIDVLINNAALILNRPFEDFSLSEYEEQMRVNSSAPFALARAVTPGMKARRSGVIINFCSVTLNGRWNGYVPYVASKGAMLGLTKSLARELGPWNIRVNAVSPGAVVSDAEARVFGDKLAEYDAWVRENQSIKERIVPHDVAAVVEFICSDGAKMITGQNIAVDGGW